MSRYWRCGGSLSTSGTLPPKCSESAVAGGAGLSRRGLRTAARNGLALAQQAGLARGRGHSYAN